MKKLYQHGTLGALMAGLMHGTTQIKEILKQGDLGIGTLHGLDGEVIVLNGEAYQGRSDGALLKLTGEEWTPYAAVTSFKADETFYISHLSSDYQVKEKIIQTAQSENIFLAIKMTGIFKNMHFRIMPKQQAPYRRLVEVSKEQPEFFNQEIEGTIVGFYTPTIFQGVSAAGFHWHFISSDKKQGGHILDFELSHGSCDISYIDELIQNLPLNDPDFRKKKIDYQNVAQEIEIAE
ncbi:acetolactate decarboxylase [Vagococcus sp.]|uniref:acetolactate decarboxylase n=1 Tax=Vagococcus sp. TaxID=1933889 RepID=UPI003F970D3A